MAAASGIRCLNWYPVDSSYSLVDLVHLSKLAKFGKVEGKYHMMHSSDTREHCEGEWGDQGADKG